MLHQLPLPDEAYAIEEKDGPLHVVAPDLAYQRLGIVNVVYVGRPGANDREWLLVDTGVPGSAGAIRRAARRHFVPHARPWAILMTHGHFDHAGSVRTLSRDWQTPVYAHVAEHPFLSGAQSYHKPDPMAGGLMSLASPLLPRGPVDVRGRLAALPHDGHVPGMPGWRWIHTPGHTPGHVSFWQESTGTLIVGDAFITTRPESAYASMAQPAEMHGPPMYFTPDWDAARESVRRLAALEPELVITGHGWAMHGPRMRQALRRLADDFDMLAPPAHVLHDPWDGSQPGVGLS